MFFFEFFLLMLTWMIFSGRTDAFHVALGVISSLIVVSTTRGMLFQDPKKGLGFYLIQFIKVPFYVLWLFWQVVLSNFHVLRLAFHPRLDEVLDPQLVTLEPKSFDNEFCHFVFANSITLTPGTITVDLEDGKYLIHAISQTTADGLPEPMESKVAATFNVGR